MVHTEGEQDSACERVSLVYLILGPTAAFQIKCKRMKEVDLWSIKFCCKEYSLFMENYNLIPLSIKTLKII